MQLITLLCPESNRSPQVFWYRPASKSITGTSHTMQAHNDANINTHRVNKSIYKAGKATGVG